MPLEKVDANDDLNGNKTPSHKKFDATTQERF